MLKVTFAQLMDQKTHGALSTVFNHKGFRDHKLNHQLAKMYKILETEQDIMQKNYIELLKKFVVCDDKGNIEPLPGQPGTFRVKEEITKSEEEMEKYRVAVEDFKKTEIEIEGSRIPLAKLEGVNLSPIDLSALDPFVIDMEEVSKGAN